jgi:thiol-disulfide isomerase/thioredoxin
LLLLGALGCGRAADVELADGRSVSWSQWDGQWLVINYWAEWCAPCRVEIPELNRLHRAGADASVSVLGVNFDGVTGPGMDKLVESFAIEFPILLADPGARWGQARPTVLPTTLVIDPQGELHDVLVGPQTFESLAEAVGLPVEEPAGPVAPAAEPEV